MAGNQKFAEIFQSNTCTFSAFSSRHHREASRFPAQSGPAPTMTERYFHHLSSGIRLSVARKLLANREEDDSHDATSVEMLYHSSSPFAEELGVFFLSYRLAATSFVHSISTQMVFVCVSFLTIRQWYTTFRAHRKVLD